ncbi:MAG: hypothetical protein BWY98_00023 [Tenericutes bacterium ADurb.BinA155]|nr:MAG: hypothetical protein BWY98_00023 [Tenericutes bacterium ADurb.BinA155]
MAKKATKTAAPKKTKVDPKEEVVAPKAEEKPAEVKAAEVKPAESAAPKPEEKPELKPEEKKPEEPVKYTYDDDHLQAVENARLDFFKQYKKDNTIKLIVSIAVVVVIVVGWIVPYLVEAWKSAALIISLCVAGVAVVGLGIYSYFFRKHSDNEIKEYFKRYYAASYDYATDGLEVKGFHADLDLKLDQKEFTDNGMYDDVYKVGSRYGVTFTYKGRDCAIVDCASQIKGKKALETTFVGKYLRMPNEYTGTGLVIYFKGNDRALPPSCIKRMNCIEENAKYAVYGDNEEKHFLTHAIRQALAQVVTNKTLVDVAISIKQGRTYMCLGYEDDLMVIPLQKPFNPNPSKEFKANLKQFLDLGLLFDPQHPAQ